MAGKDNLVTPSAAEARERGRKGGKASGEARRKKKQLRECADFLLSLPVSDLRKYNKMTKMGIPVEGIDNKMLLVTALMIEGQAGNVAAFKELRELIGEDAAPGGEVTIVDDL
ncbi:hypothetical protein LJC49_07200 [Ruminococcaceae bacterium OttesenSCG-928-I18]|nr:hypothetical protein [Ruminococcaceae bacterium OttesenSCG-928-I18]